VDLPRVDRRSIVDGCDVVLAALVCWQAADELRPATVIVAGLVLATRKAASLPRKDGSG
jgi:hypothetical protein